MIKAVIFDRDGVLVNSEGINIESAIQAFRQSSYVLSDNNKELVVGRHPDDYIPEIIERNKLKLEFVHLRKAQHEEYKKLWEIIKEPMPGVKEIFSELSNRKIIIAIATNSSREGTESFLEAYSLGDFVSFIVGGKEVTRRKPDPEIYVLTKERLGFLDEEVLVVEDTRVGVEAAKAAGLRCVAVPNSYTADQDFSEADYVIDSLDQILELIRY